MFVDVVGCTVAPRLDLELGKCWLEMIVVARGVGWKVVELLSVWCVS